MKKPLDIKGDTETVNTKTKGTYTHTYTIEAGRSSIRETKFILQEILWCCIIMISDTDALYAKFINSNISSMLERTVVAISHKINQKYGDELYEEKRRLGVSIQKV